ncbi:hypothetical protein O8E88_000461 [Flavobacterium psychrophilum]|uniref:hypothetical protein n=1 Tax=Flavobacterium psychrophilum TaxID=96345 RepID=UPI0004F63FDB|nr:hypothetical protein [Flavobacterium psychrophilum]AIN75171.1 hypothetical protein FPG3_07070 [Flavobacterium psychrophilum FPG3]EKT2068679.1 hypothetical protein [Flavobacterium psychrophilum]EKT2072801.1 hypothetical protein [Flavobacterium psychrophilum]MBF2045131.1 hypothetical protein [Flavobacterium psychrophilum]OXB15480.1 hypothetical protein B0A57_00430 [Flavobacterium psychrophilum DSM 3660 = ATCC 49418]
MKKILFIFLLFISIKSFSQSDDEFQYITSSASGTQVYVHFEKDNYGTKEFWLKMTEPVKSTKGKNGRIIKTGGGYTLEYIKMNCSEKEYSSSNGVQYYKNGNSKHRPEYYDSNDEKIIPGSIMTAVYKFICENE